MARDRKRTSGTIANIRQQVDRLMDFTTIVGLLAASCTTISYWPQLKKCWDTGSAGDLSFKMFTILAAGNHYFAGSACGRYPPARVS